MFLMVGLLSALRDARAMLEEERQRLGVAPIETGIMVEIPAAAIMAAQFAREARVVWVERSAAQPITDPLADAGLPGLDARSDLLQ